MRPAGLYTAAEPTDDYQVSSRRLPGRATSRADLADLLITEATSDEPHHSRSIIEVITRRQGRSADLTRPCDGL